MKSFEISLLVCLLLAALPVLFVAASQEDDTMAKRTSLRSSTTTTTTTTTTEVVATIPIGDVGDDEKPTIYDCLQEAAGKDDCKSIFDGQCVWCAEPVYGLCVTASFASKIGYLPLFNCDGNDNTETDTYFDADTDTDTDTDTEAEY